jgi:hypothetical protein
MSVALLLLICVVWLMSYWRCDRILLTLVTERQPANPGMFPQEYQKAIVVGAMVYPDCISFHAFKSRGDSLASGFRHREWNYVDQSSADRKFRRGYSIGWPIPGIRFKSRPNGLEINVRCWLLMGVFALLPTLWTWRKYRGVSVQRGFPIR